MNITKMSLVAALLIGSSAMALDNTKVSGDANLYYQTSDANGMDFLESGSAAADMAVNLNVTTDILKTDSVAISAGVGYTVLNTLGLEGTMVDGVWSGAHTATGNAAKGTQKVDTVSWINEAWFAATAGKTTVKVGRMELDTPLAFSEKWSIAENTFEAGVLINEDIQDTTLVGAYIGRGNGGTSGVVATSADFTRYGVQGAYAAGVINNSWKPLTAQAWFYDITSYAQATWFQADLDLSTVGVDGLSVGAQYTTLDLKSTTIEGTASAVAGMVGYEVKDTASIKLAYSDVPRNGAAGYNTATGATNGQTKLYTEAWWNYGQVTQAGAKSVNLTVEAPTSVADLGLYLTMVDHDAMATTTSGDFTEATVTATKTLGFVDATLAYIYADTKTDKSATAATNDTNTIQVYLTANF